MEIPDRKQIIINTEIPFIYRTYSNVWDIVGQAWDNSRAANPHEYWVVGLWDVWDRKQGYIYRKILFIGSFEPVKKFSPIGKMCKTVPQSHRGTRTRMNTGFFLWDRVSHRFPHVPRERRDICEQYGRHNGKRGMYHTGTVWISDTSVPFNVYGKDSGKDITNALRDRSCIVYGEGSPDDPADGRLDDGRGRRCGSMITLRDYQKECVEIIGRLEPGAYLIQMATGLGKTVTFANIRRKGRMLILSHREELVRQPLKYFDCAHGVEMAGESADPSDEVVSASVMSLTRRLDRYGPDDFDVIVCDEAHHAAAKTYRRIFEHFHPRLLLGFTATPNRADSVRLDDVFQDIVFQRDLRWGIKNGYLSDIECRRVNIGFDLRGVKSARGDYAPGELDEAMEGTADAIAQAYRELAKGATLIFAVSVHQAEEIASRIPGAAVVTGETNNRAELIAAFTRRDIPCLVNCMVFTEGTDIPLVETVIIARPTQSDSLYTQMVGRGLRLHPEKERLQLIDCVGVTGKASLCTAPSLLGIDLKDIPPAKQDKLEGMLFELPEKAVRAADCPESWIKNVQIVDLWAKEQAYNTHNINWFRMPDGSLVCSLPEGKRLTIPCQDELGRVRIGGEFLPMQKALDRAYQCLCAHYEDQRYIWDLDQAKRWGKSPASEKQLSLIRRMCRGYDPSGLTKGEASQILNRVMCRKGA